MKRALSLSLALLAATASALPKTKHLHFFRENQPEQPIAHFSLGQFDTQACTDNTSTIPGGYSRFRVGPRALAKVSVHAECRRLEALPPSTLTERDKVFLRDSCKPSQEDLRPGERLWDSPSFVDTLKEGERQHGKEKAVRKVLQERSSEGSDFLSLKVEKEIGRATLVMDVGVNAWLSPDERELIIDILRGQRIRFSISF